MNNNILQFSECRLCRSNSILRRSHVIPAFVCKSIKNASLTGHLRSTKNPKKREQDSDKPRLLCDSCEKRFNINETKFNNYIFKDFRELNQLDFKYGNWLHYFITSLTWRTLILDIEIGGIPDEILIKLKASEDNMRKYLLGESELSILIDNHILLIPAGSKLEIGGFSADSSISAIRQATTGYTIWKDNKFSSVIINLAGILCVTHIHLDPQDTWHNTKVSPDNDKLTHPQNVNSRILMEFIKSAINASNKIFRDLGDRQVEKIKNSIKTNSQ